MAISYQETDTAADCGNGVYCKGGTAQVSFFDSEAILGGTAGTAHSITIGATASDSEAINFDLVPAASVAWVSGTWTVRLNVTTANTNITWDSVWICRVSSGCVSQATIGSSSALGISFSTTGIKMATVSGSTQSPAASDKVILVFGFSNASATMTQAFSITANQLIDSPFAVVLPVPRVLLQAVNRSTTF